jgi:SAM-dependent methyltransferase
MSSATVNAMKSALKLILSRDAQLAVRCALNRAKRDVLSLGSAVTCPICARSFHAFLSFCGRPNEWCPECRSLGRHRLIFLYLRDCLGLFASPSSAALLHIAPEYCLERELRRHRRIRYVTADAMKSIVDLLGARPNVCTSLEALGFRSAEFDFVICSHVFEHIEADRIAMAEVFRVMKPGAAAIVPVPIDWQRENTDERRGLSEQERIQSYGEADHVRQYGRDFLDRLIATGFRVETYHCANRDMEQRFRIDPADPLIIAHKPTSV